jgi:hypothetical protein
MVHSAPLATGGRDDAIHAQVFHHLAVVIEAMADDQSGHSEARGRSFAEGTFDGFEEIAIMDGSDGFVGIGKRVL